MSQEEEKTRERRLRKKNLLTKGGGKGGGKRAQRKDCFEKGGIFTSPSEELVGSIANENSEERGMDNLLSPD